MDLLRAIAVELSCLSCGQKYRISLDVIAASHRALHEGCPVSNEAVRECPQETYARLVDARALEELRLAWKRVDEQLVAAGGGLIIEPITRAEPAITSGA